MAGGACGCATRPAAAKAEVTTTAQGPSELSLTADWNDVQASMLVSVSEIETAILSSDLGQTRDRFELRTIDDEPGWLEATRPPPPHPGVEDTGESVQIRLRCRIGWGDPVREGRLLKAVARRLEELRGVDYRPVKD